MPTYVTCSACKKEFRVRPARLKQGGVKYCSLDCYNTVRNSDTELTCDYCGKKYIRKAFRIKRRKVKHSFCSTICRDKAARGVNYDPDHIDYRDGYYKKQSKAMRKEAEMCHDCEKPFPSYQVHHIIPPWLFDNRKEAHAFPNLVVLCYICHRNRHKKMHSILYGMIKRLIKQDSKLKEEFVSQWRNGK